MSGEKRSARKGARSPSEHENIPCFTEPLGFAASGLGSPLDLNRVVGYVLPHALDKESPAAGNTTDILVRGRETLARFARPRVDIPRPR